MYTRLEALYYEIFYTQINSKEKNGNCSRVNPLDMHEE